MKQVFFPRQQGKTLYFLGKLLNLLRHGEDVAIVYGSSTGLQDMLYRLAELGANKEEIAAIKFYKV